MRSFTTSHGPIGRRLAVWALAIALLLVGLAVPAGATPNDGNGHKIIVDQTFGPFPIGCGDVELTVGFQAQFRPRNHGANASVGTFTSDFVYSNGAGETWVFRDRGSMRTYVVDGVTYSADHGRSASGFVGHVIIADPDGAAETVFQAGQTFDTNDLACDALG